MRICNFRKVTLDYFKITSRGFSQFITILHGRGVFPIYYNITIGGEGSTRTPNLYYVINGRPLKLPTVPQLLVRSSLSAKLFFYATRELSDWIFCSKNSKHGAGFREGGGHLTPQLDQLANLSSGVGLSLTSWGVAPSST